MIEFRNVQKRYRNGVHALNDVSFHIDTGEFVFFIGQSGAGKSTLIKLLTCEERPTGGTVVLENYDVGLIEARLVPHLRRKIGMIFQDFRLIESKTVYENVAFAMEIVGASSRQIKRRVPIVLSVVGLRNRANMYPGELSGGEAQRVGVARAMVNNPKLILADEPTGNLDPANGESIMALLEEINRAGTTVIACTHDQNLVDRMRKRVIEINDGYVVRDECHSGYSEHCQIRFGVQPEEAQADSYAQEAYRFSMREDDADRLLRESRAHLMKQSPEQVRESLAETEAYLLQARRRRQERETLAERIERMRQSVQEPATESSAARRSAPEKTNRAI